MHDSIYKALEMLSISVSESTLNDNEKNALIKLIKIIDSFYCDKVNEIMKYGYDDNRDIRFAKLTSIITDYIVAINDTVKGKNDVFSIVNMIYKEINYDNSKGKFKRKRLI